MSEFCDTIKKSGKKCTNKAKFKGKCGVHKIKTPTPVEIENPGIYVPAESPADFVTDAAHLRQTLKRYGVAVIEKVLNPDECATMNSGVWDFFESITSAMPTPLDRNDPKTWKTIFDLYPSHGMLHQHWGIGHAQYIWELRQNPKVVDIFAQLWSVEDKDLLVSFDGASLGLPHEQTNRGYYRNNKWYHFDQRLSDPSFQCVQSWVTANDVNFGDATLTVLEGSHTQFGVFSKHFQLQHQKKDWFKIDDNQIKFLEASGCVTRDITCPAGSMVFWDSRTCHAGKEALKNRERETFRNVVYLCYTPRNLATATALKKKRKAYEDGRTTSHWPHKPILFPVKPRTYGGELPNVTYQPVPELTPLGRRLAGYDE